MDSGLSKVGFLSENTLEFPRFFLLFRLRMLNCGFSLAVGLCEFALGSRFGVLTYVFIWLFYFSFYDERLSFISLCSS